MYLAHYDIGGRTWLQAAIELSYPPRTGAEEHEKWWARLRALVRNFDAVADASVSLRIRLQDELHAALFVVAPQPRADALRRAVGALTQLGLMGDGDVTFAQDRSQHDRLLSTPRFQCRVALPHLALGDAWFAFDFRVHEHLNGILAEARAQQYAVTYHLNSEALHFEPDWQRAAARNALRVSEARGIPASLERLQRELGSRLRRATHVCEEFVGVDSVEACDWLRGALQRRFYEQYGRSVEAEFSFEEDGHEGSLIATRHRVFFEPLGVDELCSVAITADERTRLVAWQPAPELVDLVPRVTGGGSGSETITLRPPDYSGLPQPYDGTGPYLFISYKRDDLDRIKPILAEFNCRGHQVWYDRGIPGGAEWDAVIEERVQNCAALLLFLSRSAVQSKYVRREVKFADSVNKPIIGVHLEDDVDLGHGMTMLLTQYQMIDGRSRVAAEEFDRAIRSARPVLA